MVGDAVAGAGCAWLAAIAASTPAWPGPGA
jgi:hypothetical protein